MELSAACTISLSNTCLDPAQRKMSCPPCAGPLDPDTGASKNLPPLAVTWSLIRFISLSASVAQSIITDVFETPASVPEVASSNTAALASGVDNIEKQMSQLDTTSLGDDLISIVLSGLDDLRLSHLEVVRFQIRSGVEGVPAMVSLRRQLTMPSPIIPRPMKPIFVMLMFVDGCSD